jgi:hypothetical protein
MSTSSYLQGRFVVPVNYTIRLIESTGSSFPTVDIDLTAGEVVSSVDALLARFNAALTDSQFAVDKSTGKIVWTPGPSMSALVHNFDQHSTGNTVVRDFLGQTANFGGVSGSSMTFPNPHDAGWYPERDIEAFQVNERSVPRSSRLLADGTGETQWGPESDVGRAKFTATLFSSSLSENESLEDFFDAVMTGHGEPFSVTIGESSYSVIMDSEPFSIQYRRVSDKLDTLWRIGLQGWSV